MSDPTNDSTLETIALREQSDTPNQAIEFLDSYDTQSSATLEEDPSGPIRNAVYVFRTANFDLGPGVNRRIEQVDPNELEGWPLKDLLKDIDEIDRKLGSHTSLSRLKGRPADGSVWTQQDDTWDSLATEELEQRGLSKRQKKRGVRFHSEHKESAAEQKKHSIRITTGTDLTKPEQILPAPRIIRHEKGPKLFVIWSRHPEKETARRKRDSSNGTLWTSYEDLALQTDYLMTDDEDYFVPRDREGYAWLRPPRRDDDSSEETDDFEDQSFPERVITGIVRATASASNLVRRKSASSVTSIKSKTSCLKAPSWLKRMPCLKKYWKAGDEDGAGDAAEVDESKKDDVSMITGYGQFFTSEESENNKKPSILKTPKDGEVRGILKNAKESEKSEPTEVKELHSNRTNSESDEIEPGEKDEEINKLVVTDLREKSEGISDVSEVTVDSLVTQHIKKAKFSDSQEDIIEKVDDNERLDSAEKSRCCGYWPRCSCTNAGLRMKRVCCIKLVTRCCGKKRRILFPRCCARLCERRLLGSIAPSRDPHISSYGDIVF